MTFDAATATESSLAQGNDQRNARTTIRDLARSCINETKDAAQATELMIQRAEHNGFIRELILRDGCAAAVSYAIRDARAVIEAGDWAPHESTGEGIAARLRNEGNSSPYNWPVPGAGRLGFATLAQVRAARIFHEKQRSGHDARARFYKSIEVAMERVGAKLVRQVITEQKLAKMMEAARD